jgi:hypothetical protein
LASVNYLFDSCPKYTSSSIHDGHASGTSSFIIKDSSVRIFSSCDIPYDVVKMDKFIVSSSKMEHLRANCFAFTVNSAVVENSTIGTVQKGALDRIILMNSFDFFNNKVEVMERGVIG